MAKRAMTVLFQIPEIRHEVRVKTHRQNKIGIPEDFIKNRNSILTLLYHKQVHHENRDSERSARNLKVKMKISSQFKSAELAQHYAVIRMVNGTQIKYSTNVFKALTNLAD